MGRGANTARNLGNRPANHATPTYIADQVKELAKEVKGFKVNVLEEADMEKLGMGSLLSVSRGSVEPAKLVTMEYNGGKKGAKPIVLVGKGVTFDTGGISLKPGAKMDEMKWICQEQVLSLALCVLWLNLNYQLIWFVLLG